MESNIKIYRDSLKVKMSICNNCDGVVRVAIEQEMTKSSRTDFMKEVLKYNLDIKTISLIEYLNNKPNWCNCK